jgi:phage terminase large subunit
LRGFEKIVIHPRCKHTADEFGSYRYKTDKITGEIFPVPIDKNNHLIDALRYALEEYCKKKVTIFDIYKAQQAERDARAQQAGKT